MRWKIDLPIEEIATRYGVGEGTYELACSYGVSQSTVWRRLRAAGVALRARGTSTGNKRRLGSHKRGGPLFVHHGYLCTHDREGKDCRIHRARWEARHGPIPTAYHVHHVNEDILDNRLENLRAMTCADHMRLHNNPGK